MIISIVNTKGGVAKTTTAIHLGAALQKHGSVVLLDADPQGSATDWAWNAKNIGQPLLFEVLAANVSTLKQYDSKSQFTIIDTPPGDSPVINAAINRADVIIVPTDTSGLDMTRTWATLDACKGHPRIVLLTKAEKNTILYKETIKAISNEDVVMFDAVIPKSQTIKSAAGTNPGINEAYAKIATELLEIA